MRQYETSAAWLNGDERQVSFRAQAPGGIHTFSWMRDGSRLQFVASPTAPSGVAGDAYGGLWWIETPGRHHRPLVALALRPGHHRVALRLQASGEVFGAASSQAVPSLTPGWSQCSR